MGFEPTTFSLARRRTTAVLRPHSVLLSDRECRDTESNCGHRDFQSRALPTELSRPDVLLLSVRDFTRREGDCQAMIVRRTFFDGIFSSLRGILLNGISNPFGATHSRTLLLLTSACFRTTMPACTYVIARAFFARSNLLIELGIVSLRSQ